MNMRIKTTMTMVSFDYDTLEPVDISLVSAYLEECEKGTARRVRIAFICAGMAALSPCALFMSDLLALPPITMFLTPIAFVIAFTAMFMISDSVDRRSLRERDYRVASESMIADGIPGDEFPVLIERYRSLYEAQGNRLLMGQIRAFTEEQKRQELTQRLSKITAAV